MNRSYRFHTASIAALLLASTTAWAQTSSGTTAAETVTTDDIIVTATRRDSTVIAAPLSITAIGNAELTKTGAGSITQIADRIPGLTFATLGTGANRFIIRGIGSFASNQSPTTGLYFDETPLQVRTSTGLFSPDPIIYDLARVEVLRGPQGTLFGSSAMGGSIRFISNKPDASKFEGSVYGEAAHTTDGGDSYNVKAMLNIPLAEDKLALRIVGVHSYDAGWIDNISPVTLNPHENLDKPNLREKDVNWVRTNAVRAMLAFTPDDTLRITPSLYYSRVKGGAVKPLQDVAVGIKKRVEGRWIPEPLKTSVKSGNMLVEKDVDLLGGATILSSSSYTEAKLDRVVDVTGFGPLQGGLPTPPGRAILLSFNAYQKLKQFTQDLRVTSTGDGPLSYVIGGYYNNNKAPSLILSLVEQDYGLGYNPTQRIRDFRFKQKEAAAYGELTFKTGPFELAAGGRYFHYNQTDSRAQIRPFRAVPVDYDFSVTTKESGFTPHLTASYKPSPNQNFYATYSQGFRTGGVNAPLTEAECPVAQRRLLGIPDNPGPFKSDKVTNYEVGAKIRTHGVQVTGAAYQVDWQDYQQATSRSCGLTGFSFTANAGKVRSRGGEAEVTIKPVEGLTLSGNMAYIKATFLRANPSLRFAKGDRLPDVPDFTYGASAEFTMPVNDSFSVQLRGDFNHVPSMRTATGTSTGATPDRRPKYTMANASASLVSTQDWELSLFVRNLTDASPVFGYDTGYPRSAVGGASDMSALVGRPRTMGVSFQKGF